MKTSALFFSFALFCLENTKSKDLCSVGETFYGQDSCTFPPNILFSYPKRKDVMTDAIVSARHKGSGCHPPAHNQHIKEAVSGIARQSDVQQI